MKNENEGIELNIIKGIIGISGVSKLSLLSLNQRLTNLLYYNDRICRYKIDKIKYMSIGFTIVYGITNEKRITVTQRKWWDKI